jgi:signal transduction histidine kinase
VLGDSDFDDLSLRLLENHRGRPEVEAALAGGIGKDTRLSTSTNRPELKIALAAWPGVVRVSAPLEEVNAVVRGAQQSVLVAVLVALLFGTAWAAFGGRHVGRPLAQLSRAARQLAAGDQPAFPSSGIPEIRQLVQALRSMDAELRTRIDELRREREESAALIEAMVEGVVAAAEDGTVVICNDAARRILGYGPEVRLPNLRALFHQREARQVVEQAMAGDTVADQELELGGRSLLLAARPLPKGGAILVMHDVTAVKRLEVMRRDFVANASHELKTPLTSISGYAETLLADESDPDTRHRFLEIIAANARRMQRLVDDLLDLARLESGRWQPSPVALDLALAARDAWAPFADRADQGGVRLSVDVPAHIRPHADPEAMREILTNLFDNAIRHTPKAGEVSVTAESLRTGIEIRVSDTGSGIPAEHLPRVFERFYRVDPGRSREEGGTGLGLSIVKHLVEAHGGKIQVESSLGHGTTMRIFLPYSITGAARATPANEATAV